MNEIFFELQKILSSLSDEVFLDCGLLLKKTRGDDLFPSSDIDFGIISKYRSAVLDNLEIFEQLGYAIKSIGDYKRFFEGLNLSKNDSLGNLVSCDIYFYYRFGDFYVRPNSHKPIHHGQHDKFFFLVFKKIQDIYDCQSMNGSFWRFVLFCPSYLLGFCYFSLCRFNQFRFPEKLFKTPHIAFDDQSLKVKCLRESQSYLRWRYGDEWMIKNKNYRFSDSRMLCFCGGVELFYEFLKAPTDLRLCHGGNWMTEAGRGGSSQRIFKVSPFEFSKSEVSSVRKRMRDIDEQGHVD